MKTLTIHGVNFTLTNRTAEIIELTAPYTRADFLAKSQSERNDLMTRLNRLLDTLDSFSDEYGDALQNLFAFECWDRDAYCGESYSDFLEYASHMNEPDFDWDFYSDWHKDMYGFRPH